MTYEEKLSYEIKIREYKKIESDIFEIEKTLKYLTPNERLNFYISSSGTNIVRVNNEENVFGNSISSSSIIKLALENCKKEIISAYKIQLDYLKQLQSKL
jgi:hypothetical protein